MSKDNKKLLIYLGILFMSVLLAYKLPQNSYSIMENIMPPIKSANNSGVFYPSSIVLLILFGIGLTGISNLERFEGKSKFIIFIVVLVTVIPLMRWTLDVTRTNYHWIKDDGLKAIDIEDATTNTSISNSEMKINIKLELKDYGRNQNRFKVRVHLPENLSDYVGEEFYDFENTFSTHGRRNTYTIEDDIVITGISEDNRGELINFRWNLEDICYELYNDEENIKIVKPRF